MPVKYHIRTRPAPPRFAPVPKLSALEFEGCLGCLRPGDRLLAVGGHAVHRTGEVAQWLHDVAAQQEPIELTIQEGRHIRWATRPMPAHSCPVHPTQIYSAINALLICLLLLASGLQPDIA